jgi:hypothetical protein
MRGLALGISLHTGGIGHAELPGQEVDDLGRHSFQRISQEPADIAGRRELNAEAETMVVTSEFRLRHQLVVAISQVEEQLKIRLRHRIAIVAEGGRFLITEKLHRHGRTVGPNPYSPTNKR